jgi:5-methylthioadenosine/S-adenosylhomocysteine deaminase
LTLNETEIIEEASHIARRIDAFLMAREGSILSKLLAISADFIPQETFEIQVKVRLPEPIDVPAMLQAAGIEVQRASIRNQYDTYFFFEDREAGRLRFREDEVKDERGELKETFYTMTLIGPAGEKEFENSILLTRARYTASANHSLRFYREYFRPTAEREVVKHRRRCHILYKETDIAINLDQLVNTDPNTFYLEIKARTWSAKDAMHKAELIGELLEKFGFKREDQFNVEYIDLAP